MAERIINFRIINIEEDPKLPGRTIVSIKAEDGDTAKGPWIQAFSIITPEIPLTEDEFAAHLIDQKIQRPLDPMQHLKAARESGHVFTLNLTDSGLTSDQT